MRLQVHLNFHPPLATALRFAFEILIAIQKALRILHARRGRIIAVAFELVSEFSGAR